MSHEEPIAFRSRTASDSEGMDMTPMVDVTFLLLIFFMVTAAFAIQRSFEMPQPENSEPSTNATFEELEQDPDYLLVRIDAYNTYHISAARWNDEQEVPNPVDLLIKMREAVREAPRNCW
jgi:biopolymer transport protein ExbD